MKNVMFMTIGNRDLQSVMKTKESGLEVRERFDYRDIGKFSVYSVIDHTNIPEKPKKSKSIDFEPTDKICFPMFTKAMNFLQNKDIMAIDHLYLVCTRRDHIVKKLEKLSISNSLSDQDKGYATELLDHAISDTTFNTSTWLKDSIEGGSIPDMKVTIPKVTILELGSYGFLTPLLQMDEKEPDIGKTLRRADINILDFFEYELYNGLREDFADLENSHVFLATYSGGMPLMQRALDTILQSCICHATYHRIFNSETQSFMLESDSQHEFLALHRQMNISAVEMDWESTRMFWESIVEMKPDYYSEIVSGKMKKLFLSITKAQKAEDQWFSNFFVLILRALYRQDYNNLHIWIKAIEEAAWINLLKINQSDCNYTLILDDKTMNGKDKNHIELSDGSRISISYSEVVYWLKNLKHLEGYKGLFYKKYGRLNDKFENIRKRRNKLIHNGNPIQKEDSMIDSVLKFIGTTNAELKDTIQHVKETDWEKVMAFEKKLLCESNFFKTLKQIGGITDPDWLPVERINLKRYIEIINPKISESGS